MAKKNLTTKDGTDVVGVQIDAAVMWINAEAP